MTSPLDYGVDPEDIALLEESEGLLFYVSPSIHPDEESEMRINWTKYFGELIWLEESGKYRVPIDNLTPKLINDHIATVFGLNIIGDEPFEKRLKTNDASGGYARVELLKPEDYKSGLGPVPLAIKYLKSDHDQKRQCTRFVRELRVWKEMNHDHILPLLGIWINFDEYTAPLPAFVSHWKSGGSLASYLGDAGKLTSMKKRMELNKQIIDALQYMHNHRLRVSHGDLHARNILYENGSVYLCDFGLSRRDDGFGGFSTGSGTNVRWAAPERLLKTFCIPSPESDMYEYGSTFWEVITGLIPYHSVTNSYCIPVKRIRREIKLPQPHNMPLRIWDFVGRCMAFQPEERITSTTAFKEMQEFVREGIDWNLPPPCS